MPAEVFGGRVHDDVGAEDERLLQRRRRERVVDDDEGADRVPDLGEAGDVGDPQQRVRRRLDPHDLRRRGLDGGAHGVEITHVDDAQAHAPRPEHPGEQSVGAAVDVAAEQHLVAGRERGAQQRVFGGEPRGERERVRPALDRGELGLQRCARRVSAAPVLVPTAQPADAVLGIRRREVHGRNDGAGGGVGLLAGVDGEAREPAGDVTGHECAPSVAVAVCVSVTVSSRMPRASSHASSYSRER